MSVPLSEHWTEQTQHAEISLMLHRDEAEYIEQMGRCPQCSHLNALHDGRGCQMCRRDSTPR